MRYDLADREITPDFDFRLKKSEKYLFRHFQRRWWMRLFFRLCETRIRNFMYDCVQTGWNICNNQYQNVNNELYWAEQGESEAAKKG